MKTTVKKILAIALSLVMVIAATACSREDDSRGLGTSVKIDKTKTQLNVANAYGGVGDAWLKEIAKQFEEIYAEVSFEENKKGVQVVINNKLVGDMGTSHVLSKIQNSSDAVWFGESIQYFDIANSGKILDVTDIVSTPLEEYGETESILDKLAPYLVDALETSDNKYYALPFWDGFYNMYYDVQLWEDNCLYFREGYSTENLDVFASDVRLDDLFIYSLNDTKSAGPDGIPDTLDDGLPITYNDWFAVSKYMFYECGIVPSVWTGTYILYLIYYAVALWANEAGYDAMLPNFSLSGTAKDLITVDNAGNITRIGDTPISAENGYALQRQESKYKVLQYIYDVVHHSYMYDSLSFGSLSHTGAQDRFLYSSNLTNVQTIGTLIEGAWWHNEATSSFNNMADEFGSKWSRDNRRIGIIPPFRSSYSQEPLTLVSAQNSMMFINNAIKGVELDLAKKFYRYLHTDKALKTFTKITCMTRAFDYEIEGQELEDMSYYAQSAYLLKKNANILYEVPTSDFMKNNPLTFRLVNWSYNSKVDKDTHTNPFVAFHSNANLTPEQYFKGLYDYQESGWRALKK